MKNISRWQNNTLRRLAIVVISIVLYPVSVVCGAFIGATELVKEYTESIIKVWKRPN